MERLLEEEEEKEDQGFADAATEEMWRALRVIRTAISVITMPQGRRWMEAIMISGVLRADYRMICWLLVVQPWRSKANDWMQC